MPLKKNVLSFFSGPEDTCNKWRRNNALFLLLVHSLPQIVLALLPPSQSHLLSPESHTIKTLAARANGTQTPGPSVPIPIAPTLLGRPVEYLDSWGTVDTTSDILARGVRTDCLAFLYSQDGPHPDEYSLTLSRRIAIRTGRLGDLFEALRVMGDEPC